MKILQSERAEHALYLLFAWAVAVVPIVYMHNGIVTEYYFSKTVWANLFIPLSVGIFAWLSIKQERIVIPKTRVLLPLGLFCVWALLSLTWTTNPYKGIELIGKVGAGPAVFFGAICLLRTREQLKGMLYLVIWTMVIVTVYGFVQYFEVTYLPKDQYGDADPSTTIGLTNFVIEYLASFLLTAPILAFLDRRRWVRMLLIVATGAVLLYLVIARNRAGMLAFLSEILFVSGVLTVVAWRMRDRFSFSRRQVGGVIAAMMIGIVGLLGGTEVGKRVTGRFTNLMEPRKIESVQEFGPLDTFLLRARRDASVRFRMETWYQCLKNMFPDNPVAGVGIANLEVEFPRYYTDFLENMTLKHNTRVVRSHNEFVQVLVDMGIVGFILFMWMLVQLGRTSWSSFVRVKNRNDLLLWLAITTGFVGYSVEMFFAFPLQVPTSSMYFFLAMAMAETYGRILRSEERGEEESSYFQVELDRPLPKAVAWGSLALFAAGSLRMEVFAWNALVGEVRNKEARVYKRYKKWDEAYALLSDAIDHYPWMEGYYYDRAVVQMQKKENEKALEDLKQTATLVPNYAMGRKQIGMLASRLNKTSLAIGEFQKTMEIYKLQREELSEIIGKTAIRGRRPELAIPIIEETLAMNDAGEIELDRPENLYRLLSDLYALQGDATKSAEIFTQLRELGYWNASTRVRYAVALLNSGEVTAAETEVRDVLGEQSRNAEGWLTLGKVLSVKGDGVGALDALNKAVTLDPDLRNRIRSDSGMRKDPVLKKWIAEL